MPRTISIPRGFLLIKGIHFAGGGRGVAGKSKKGKCVISDTRISSGEGAILLSEGGLEGLFRKGRGEHEWDAECFFTSRN